MFSYVKPNGNVRVVEPRVKQRNVGKLADRTHLPQNQQTGVLRNLRRLERAMRISAGKRPVKYLVRNKRDATRATREVSHAAHDLLPALGGRMLRAAAQKALAIFNMKKSGLFTNVDLGKIAAE